MRGAGCTINDLWDRNLDRAVGTLFPDARCYSTVARPARTKDRPLASRSLSPQQAIGFLALQLSAGLAILLQLNWYRYESHHQLALIH
jgi:4-hydroxybenzoate polyprenyltransferase